MDIDGITWLEQIIDKLAAKHLVEPDEVEQILTNARSFRRIQRGDIAGEDLYATLWSKISPNAIRFRSISPT